MTLETDTLSVAGGMWTKLSRRLVWFDIQRSTK